MPKTSKKNTTTAKKNSVTKRRFDLKNTKVQFFVAILIVGLLGGGYMVYRSYAATQNEYVYNLNNKSIQILEKTTPQSEAKKNNKTVAVMQQGGKISASVPNTVFPVVPANQPVRFCLISNTPDPQVRVTQKDSNGRVRYYGDATETTNTKFSRSEVQTLPSGYWLACTFKRTRSYALAGPITVVNTGFQTNVSDVILRFVDGTTTGTVPNW